MLVPKILLWVSHATERQVDRAHSAFPFRQVEAQGPAEIAKINEKPPENIVRLLRQAAPLPSSLAPPPLFNPLSSHCRDVNNELAEAQREVLQLRDENMALMEEKGKYQTQENVSERTSLSHYAASLLRTAHTTHCACTHHTLRIVDSQCCNTVGCRTPLQHCEPRNLLL